MILGKLFNYILLATIICSFGCSRLESLGEDVGEATLVIHIDQEKSTGTKSVLDETDERTINTLSVWLVDMSGNIQRTSFTSPESASSTIEFANVERGEHKLYIVANYTGLDSHTSGKIDDSFKNTVLSEITSGNSPQFTSSQGIPCSIVQDVAISAGINDIHAHLIRTVARLSVTFRNLVPDKDLYIGNVFLSRRNQSKGYLFYKDDHSNPIGSENLYFPDLGESEIIKIPAGGTGVVYDTYLYETSLEPTTFNVQFSGGFYPAGSAAPGYTIANVTSYNIGEITNNYDNSSKYLIRPYSYPNKFLGVDDSGTSLVLKTYDNDEQIKSDGDIESCLWIIDSEDRVRSAKYENKYLLMNSNSVSLGGVNSNTDIFKYSGGVYFRYGSDTYTYFNINYNATGVEMGTYYFYSSIWYLRKVNEVSSGAHPYKKFTAPEVELNFANVYPVNYIDNYGLPHPLQHICRNEHLDLTVNISQNTATGNFDFKVSGWVIKDNLNTDFN